MFGELIGAWLVLAWRELGRPAQPGIRRDRAWSRYIGQRYRAYHGQARAGPARRRLLQLIEVSPALARKQATTLRGSGGAFDWVNADRRIAARPAAADRRQ